MNGPRNAADQEWQPTSGTPQARAMSDRRKTGIGSHNAPQNARSFVHTDTEGSPAMTMPTPPAGWRQIREMAVNVFHRDAAMSW